MFQKLLEQIAQGLNHLSIDYMVIGGQALLVYGEARITKDIDLTLGIGTERSSEILSLVSSQGWKTLSPDPQEFIKKTMVLPCQDPASGIRIDFIFSFSPYEKAAIQRAQSVTMGKTKVQFASPEDFIIHKMVAGRPRDLEDIRTVLLKNPNLDFPYIQKWLEEFQKTLGRSLGNLFQEIRQELK